jgi:hypothetical protein
MKREKCFAALKTMYLDKQDAEETAKYENSRSPLNHTRVYTCEFCTAYHLTHRKNKMTL